MRVAPWSSSYPETYAFRKHAEGLEGVIVWGYSRVGEEDGKCVRLERITFKSSGTTVFDGASVGGV